MAYQIKASFDASNQGILESNGGKTAISFTNEGLAPYELLLGGFASCLHATFKSICSKKRLEFEHVDYNVVGVKREEIPTLLKEVTTVVTITGVNKDKEKAIQKAMEQAERYCSISATLKTIAEMKFEIIFK